MTENEAIKILQGAIKKPNTQDGYLGQSVTMAIQALEEIQQYRAIGTIEELQELKEKSVAKKVNIQQWIDTKCDCGYEFSKHHGDGYYSIPYEKQTKYCPECGQKLDFGEEE